MTRLEELEAQLDRQTANLEKADILEHETVAVFLARMVKDHLALLETAKELLKTFREAQSGELGRVERLVTERHDRLEALINQLSKEGKGLEPKQ